MFSSVLYEQKFSVRISNCSIKFRNEKYVYVWRNYICKQITFIYKWEQEAPIYMLAKKVCKSLKILFKIIGNLCSCMSSVNSSLKCQNQTLEINFFQARIVFRYKIFFQSLKYLSAVLKEFVSRSFSIGSRPWQAGIVISLKENMVDCMGCGGISDYNLHYNNKKMEIFYKHNLPCIYPCDQTYTALIIKCDVDPPNSIFCENFNKKRS